MLTDVHVRENVAASARGALLVEQLQRAVQVGTNTEFFIRGPNKTTGDTRSL